MTITQTQSSLIEKFSYDEPQRVLHVWFRRGGHYSYAAVEPEAFESFRASESHGKHFLTEIKNNYLFSKHND